MKILLVDDHALIRDALRGVLKELKPEATTLEAADCAQALKLLEEHSGVKMILLDLGLPDRDGFSALAELRERYPSVAIVVLSAFNDRDNVARALELGAAGFIPKSGRREVMLSALNLIFSGGVYIPVDILGPPISSRSPSATDRKAVQRPGPSPADLGLTGRQVDILALMMHGKSNKAIGRVLDLAEPTVKNHVTAILKALNVTNRTEAVIKVGTLGWRLPVVSE